MSSTQEALLQRRSYDEPDEVRTPPKTRVEVVRLGDVVSARTTFEPGWRWSECVKPVAGTETCQNRHIGAVASGHLTVSHGDETIDLGPGDTYVIEPGHDAWVVGDEPFVGFEFESHAAQTYAAGPS